MKFIFQLSWDLKARLDRTGDKAEETDLQNTQITFGIKTLKGQKNNTTKKKKKKKKKTTRNCVKGDWYTCRTGNYVKICVYSFLQKVYSKRKEFAPIGSRFFPLRVDVFSEGFGKQ